MASFSSFLPSRKARGGAGIGFELTGTQPIAAARANGNHAATDAIFPVDELVEMEEEDKEDVEEEEDVEDV